MSLKLKDWRDAGFSVGMGILVSAIARDFMREAIETERQLLSLRRLTGSDDKAKALLAIARDLHAREVEESRRHPWAPRTLDQILAGMLDKVARGEDPAQKGAA